MKSTSITARILAAVALLGAVAAVLVVVGSETGDEGATRAPAASKSKGKKSGPNENAGNQDRSRGAKVYVVKEGDSLTLIAEKTGIQVETIEALNPDVDPQALIPGQKLKLR